MTKPKEVIADWIQKCIDEGRDLTSWECGFLGSLDEQFADSGSISDRQEEILERIYASKTPL